MAIVAEGYRQRVFLPPDNAHAAASEVPIPDDAPDTELPEKALGFRVQAYGIRRHSQLFTNRQLTALCAMTRLLDPIEEQVLSDSGGDAEYARAIRTYLSLAISRGTDLWNAFTSWNYANESIRALFARQAVPMVWDFCEVNPFSESAGLGAMYDLVTRALQPSYADLEVRVEQRDAVIDGIPPGVICTDPPYYDNIGYADLSDFFYVWLRRCLREALPELFGTVLTPKSTELISTPYRHDGSRTAADAHFEEGFRKAFSNIAAAQEADTPMTIFYAFKQSEEDGPEDGSSGGQASTGWEKMLTGLLAAGLTVTGTWPMRTEREVRSVGLGTNALASSIVLVCRSRPATAGVTDRRGFQQTLKRRLAHDLRVLQSGGVAPVDLAQAAIGPGMAVFSAYTKVVEPDGAAMSVRRALQLINQILDEVTAEQEGEFDEDTRFAIAWYSEYGIDDGPYGRADDLSRAKNVSVDGLVRAGIVKAGGGKVRLLDRSELDADWDPATDSRLTVWEVAQHLIRRLLDDGEASAAELLSRVGGLGDAARDLSYRLFQIAESKKWAKEAGPYNALAAAWPELSRLAAGGPMGQGSLNV